MMKMKLEEQIYKYAVILWGKEAQLLMLVEEISEFRIEHSDICHADEDKCVERESADVSIMLEQMKVMFDFEIDNEFRGERLYWFGSLNLKEKRDLLYFNFDQIIKHICHYLRQRICEDQITLLAKILYADFHTYIESNAWQTKWGCDYLGKAMG